MRRNKFFLIRGLAGTHLENSIIDFNVELMREREKFIELFLYGYKVPIAVINIWLSFMFAPGNSDVFFILIFFVKIFNFHRLSLSQRKSYEDRKVKRFEKLTELEFHRFQMRNSKVMMMKFFEQLA